MLFNGGLDLQDEMKRGKSSVHLGEVFLIDPHDAKEMSREPETQ
jgi:hypothetical protein